MARSTKSYEERMLQLEKKELENGAVIEGGKTGFTDEAGQCLVSFAEYGGEEYILVTAEAMTDSGSAVDSIADASTVYGRLQ